MRRGMLRPEIHREGRCGFGSGFGFLAISRLAWPRRLLVAGQLQHAFPGAEEIEAAEFLGQLHRLIDHALLLLVVAHLDIAGQREILAQRMAFETVIGQDAAQIGMVGEEDAVESQASRSNQPAAR